MRLAQSIPLDDLHTVITELGKALNGQSDNLSRLVDSLSTLAADGADNLPATIGLIRDANSVLATQADQSDAILTWSHGLDVLTATLSASDPDLRRLLTTGNASASRLSELVQRNGGDAAKVVHDLASVTRTLRPATYTTSLTFAMLSNISAGSHSTAPGDGRSISVSCSRRTTHRRALRDTRAPPASSTR